MLHLRRHNDEEMNLNSNELRSKLPTLMSLWGAPRD
jgi:hypothetical protein